MNIFDELDNLVKLANGKSINESKSEVDFEDYPIDPHMENAEQARLYVRDYFAKLLDADSESGGTPPEDIPEPPKKISGPKPPPPPFKKKFKEEEGPESKDWEEDEVVWDSEDAMREMEMDDEIAEADELEDKMEKEYDDFMDKSGDGSGSGGDESPYEKGTGGEDDEDDDWDDEDDEDGEAGDDTIEDGGGSGEGSDDGEDDTEGSEKGSGKSSSKKPPIKDGFDGDDLEGGDRESEKSGSDGDKKDSKGIEKSSDSKGGYGKPGEDSGGGDTGSDALKSSIDDAIERLKERADADKEMLKKLSDMAKDGASSEEMEDMDNSIDAEKEGKASETKDLIGRTETSLSKEDLDKEISDAKISDEDKKSMIGDSDKASTAPSVIDDEELEKIKTEAVKELEKKCEGHSSLSTEILYHATKDAKIEDSDWKEIVKQILKDKSIHHGSKDSKIKKSAWGHKNHLWRGSILPTKVVRRGGEDTQSIYCFIDYSGSVSSRPNLIVSFLGKIMELCMNLQYSDLILYTFADKLSLPKKLTKKMIDKDGYEKVLAQTIAYFNDPVNDVGSHIENFSVVANEINKIKIKDKNAVSFIFGDGMWTFYSTQTDPPMRLREMCPKWLDDIIAFVFYDYIHEVLQKEIGNLKYAVGIKHIITTKMV